MGVRLIRIMRFLVLLCGFLLFTLRAEAMVTNVGGETITWDFQGIPSSSFFSSPTPCTYRADTNFWTCEYGIIDPPYIIPVNFSASLTPTHGRFPDLGLYYSGINQYPYHLINSVSSAVLVNLSNQVSFYIPASATVFRLIYHSNDTVEGATQTNIQFNFSIANYDPNRANLLGGEDINADTEFCEENGQPGKPRIRKFRNKKGDGPGT